MSQDDVVEYIRAISYEELWYIITLSGKNPNDIPGRKPESTAAMEERLNNRLDDIEICLKKIKKAVYASK